MILAVMTVCLSAQPAACGPILLAGQSFSVADDCAQEAPRIAAEWLAGHPGLVRRDLACRAVDDLPALALREVAPGVHVHLGQIAQFENSPDGWIANLGFVIGQTGIAVIDAGASRAQGQALLAAIRQVSDKPITHLIVTHMHPDHALGAEVFREAGATVVGHARLGPALQARGPVYLDNLTRLYGAGPMIGTRIVLPDLTVADRLDLDLGGRVLTLTASGPAHTDNDLTVLDRTSGTLFSGDLVFRGLTPVLDGSLPGWLGWMDQPQDVSVLVPGHGLPTGDWDDAIGPQRDLMAALGRATRDALDAGLPLSRAVPVIVQALQPLAGDWVAFPETIARNATAAYKELEWQ